MNHEHLRQQSHHRIQRWLAEREKQGFTPTQAWDFAQALEKWASPWLFSNHALGLKPILQDIQKVHQTLKQDLEVIQSPEQWEAFKSQPKGFSEAWWNRYGLFLNLQAEAPDTSPSSIEEPSSWPPAPPIRDWRDIEERLIGKIVLPDLISEYLMPWSGGEIPLEMALEKTGLQSIRWGWFEEVRTDIKEALSQILLRLQEDLSAPFGWTGPVLGLNFETGLLLTRAKRPPNTGQVILNHHQPGQQLSLDTWEVLPHEWLHTLDCTLARTTGRAHKWSTLAIMEGEDSLPHDSILEEALLNWWEQVVRVQFSPLPESVFEDIKLELQHWPLRIINALGDVPKVRRRLHEEQNLIKHNKWTVEVSKQKWLNFLNQSHPHLSVTRRRRAASLISGEIGLAIHPDHIPQDEPVWIGFLNSFADADEPNPKTCTDCHAYLVNPVEVMARSFEVAFQTQEPRLSLWHAPPPQAGMIWPLEPERLYQREGWIVCFQALEEWWLKMQGKSTAWDLMPFKAQSNA